MALPSFDSVRKEEDDWTQVRARLSVAKKTAGQRHGAGTHSGRLLFATIVAVIATILIMGLASRQGTRLLGLLDGLWQMAQEYTGTPITPGQVSRKTPEKRSSKEHSAKTRVTQKPALPLDAPSPSAAAPQQMSEFAEVVDPSNRHYLVRYRPSPVVPLPGEQLPPRADADAGLAPAAPLPRTPDDLRSPRQVTSVNLRAYVPGSAGIVVLQGLVGKDGRVSDLTILSGPPELAQAAAEAAQRWHYVPEYYNGRPRERLVQITVDFTVLLTQ
jgi:TonB family protein